MLQQNALISLADHHGSALEGGAYWACLVHVVCGSVWIAAFMLLQLDLSHHSIRFFRLDLRIFNIR